MKIGFTEIILIFIVALIVIGPDKLPFYAKKLGTGLREFRKATDDMTKDIRESVVEPLEEAQKPIREAMEPFEQLDRDVRNNFKETSDSLNNIGKAKKPDKAADGTDADKDTAVSAVNETGEGSADEGSAEELPDERAHTAALEKLVGKYEPSILLLGATAFGRSLAPRLAARLETGLTADCTGLEIDPETGLLRQTRPAFGGNLMATIVCPEHKPQMATVRPKVFQRIGGQDTSSSLRPPSRQGEGNKVIRETFVTAERCFEFLERVPAAEETDIGAADVLISVGQGIGGAENIAMAEELARKMGGTVSSSRPLVDSGVMPYARQVGQTGKTVAPKLYLALGISGAIQHMAGVAAKTIVAVNTDPDAPIFGCADFAVRCDCGEFLRAMLDKN